MTGLPPLFAWAPAILSTHGPQICATCGASRALPGRHMLASQFAKGKSFTAPGAILGGEGPDRRHGRLRDGRWERWMMADEG